jgi:hypothetical protein
MSKRYHKPAHKTDSAKANKTNNDPVKKAKASAAVEDTHEESHSESAEEPDQERTEGSSEHGHEEYKDAHHADSHDSEDKSQKIRLEFFGSDIIRAQVPEMMKIADSIADDWVKDGDFDKIPVGNPIAQAVVGKGLRKAKEVEKKLEEKGVFMMARMGADYLKSKIKRS